jgi:hypothetical protein
MLPSAMNYKFVNPSDTSLSFSNTLYEFEGRFAGWGITYSTNNVNTVQILFNGDQRQSWQSGNAQEKYILYYGTGTAPTTGSTSSFGTEITKVDWQEPQQVLGYNTITGYSLSSILTGLTLNQTYWFDLRVVLYDDGSTPRTIYLTNNFFSIIELAGPKGDVGPVGPTGPSGPAIRSGEYNFTSANTYTVTFSSPMPSTSYSVSLVQSVLDGTNDNSKVPLYLSSRSTASFQFVSSISSSTLKTLYWIAVEHI